MARAASVPLDSSQQGSRLSRSQSLGSAQYPKPRSNSVAGYRIDTIQLSPIAASFVSSDDGSVTSPIAIVQRAPRTEADIAREARRRKLLKIQAFLGERVPASAIKDVAGVIGQPLKPTRGVPMFSKASSRLHRRLTKSKRVNVPLSDHESDWRQSHRRRLEIDTENPASLSMDERSRRISQTSDSNAEDVRPPGVALFSNSRAAHGLMGRGSQFFDDPSREDIGKAAEPVILAVRRARKLEKVRNLSSRELVGKIDLTGFLQVFGSLPPAQLYARMNKWVPRQDDFASDNLSVRSKVSRGSLQRARIASIRFIAESEDPDLVEDFARVVLSQESDASDVENAAVGLSSLVDNAAFEMRHASQARRDRADAAADSDDPEHEEEGSEELLGVQADKSITDRQPSFDSETRSTGDHSRSSRDTGSSHALHQANDLHIRLGLSGASSPAGTDLFNQRYDRSKVRKTRDSILSAATAHSSVGSAYVVDPFGRPQRSHSRASPSTSVEGGTPRSSMDSVRLQFKRAHKLATVFGTTRGEVFNRVLDDIEADIAEADDEEMDEEERKEIIESVTALRASL